MLNEIKQETKLKMEKSVAALQSALAKLRSGRAHPSLLDQVSVPYYDVPTPLSQVASVTIADSRTLMVTPWEKILLPVIEKAIMVANLGLNPSAMGDAIRVPLPALTEERRKEMTRAVRSEAENARISVRNVRKDSMKKLKDLLKSKEISEDDERRAQDVVQKTTDKFVAEIDSASEAKEKELMEF